MGNEPDRQFSRRQGHSGPNQEISVRNDAPYAFRAALLQIAREVGLSPTGIRSIACRVLRMLPDPGNWSEYPNIWQEAQDLILGCEWYRVYDITEAIAVYLSDDTERAEQFVDEINTYFKESGIGWQLVDGLIQTRGTEAFEASVRESLEETLSDHPTSENEIKEAIADLSRRPDPDLTGAIQHSMAALECIARDACGDQKATFGEILKRYPELIPKPLDQALEKAWGYSSEMGRHLREGRPPSREDAELMVSMSAAVVTYLAQQIRSTG